MSVMSVIRWWLVRPAPGKSVLLALMALQFRRYPGSQIFAFDFGGSIRAAAIAMGGDWHDLGGALSDDASEPVALQPLAWIDDPSERGWATEWIAAILAREKIEITPEAKDHLWSALTSLASAPIQERTLTGLSVLLQSSALKRALQPYCLGGPYGRLLDAELERLGEASVQAFETEGLIGTGAAPAVLAYLFHRIGDRLDGRPTLLIVDEGWLALDDEDFAGQLREWLKTLRKKNASVIFATQSLSDIDGSAIAPAIIESCPTRILLPNERAIEPQITAIYQRFGLNDRQIELLSRATPKRDYYCQSRRGNRMFELGLGEVALAFTAASSKTDQAAIERLLAEHGRDGFVPAWLRQRDASWATDLIPNLSNLETIVMRRLCVLAAASAVALSLGCRCRRHLRSGSSSIRTTMLQNVLTAARELQQINNQITSLQNQAQMLINQAKNLANLPYSSLQQLQSSIQRTQQLLAQAQRIAYDVQQIDRAFSTNYAPATSSQSNQALITNAQSRWQNSVAALQDALRVQAGVVGNLDTNRTQTSALVTSSQGASGALQATQAGNQILALQAQQLADLTATVAAQGRAQSLEAAQRAAAQDQGREQLRRFLTPGQGYQSQDVQMFH